MSIRRDLEEWTANQIAGRAVSSKASDIRRLLRGDEVGPLAPVDSRGYPSEFLEAMWPGAEFSAPPAQGGTWICWPSADNAPYGWGDPYGPNPPLGTVQPSFSDTAHIARELDANDSVTHGVNKIAGPRDWRDNASRLVVSWSLSSIYSDGVEIIAGASIHAACVRYDAGNPYLLWLESASSPARVWSQPCEIVNDAVTQVTGSPSYATVALTGFFWSEFSISGNKLVMCVGVDITVHASYSVDVPTAFTGQSLTTTDEEQTKPENKTWTDFNNYSCDRDFLVKSQYIGDTLVHTWVRVFIEEVYQGWTQIGEELIPEGYYTCNTCASVNTYDRVLAYPGAHWDKMSIFDSFEVKITVLQDAVEQFSYLVTEYLFSQYRWDVNGVGYEGFSSTPQTQFPSPTDSDWDGGTWPCGIQNQSCSVSEQGYSSNPFINLRLYTFMPATAVDARHDRQSIIDLGDKDVHSGTETKRLRGIIWRNGFEIESVEIDGEYGYVEYPDEDTIDNTIRLSTEVEAVARTFCPHPTVTGDFFVSDGLIHYAGMDLPDGRVIQCFRARSETDDEDDYLDQLEGGDIDAILSIDGEDNPRIIIEHSTRYFGLLKT